LREIWFDMFCFPIDSNVKWFGGKFAGCPGAAHPAAVGEQH
jgi:hypothetical protein